MVLAMADDGLFERVPLRRQIYRIPHGSETWSEGTLPPTVIRRRDGKIS